MPKSNAEAAAELDRMRLERDLSYAWIARYLGRDERSGLMWVKRKLTGQVPMRIDDYNEIRSAIESVTPSPHLLEVCDVA